jgi:TonB family protein
LLLAVTISLGAQASAQTRNLRLAVLDLGQTTTALVAREAITKQLSVNPNMTLVDRDQARAAANGVGYHGSLNLSLQEARDLGSAIGCDFMILGEADTLRRSPSTDPSYFESYVSIFIVSARTGRLVLWEKSVGKGPTAKIADERMLVEINAPQTTSRYLSALVGAMEKEAAERLQAIEQPAAVIEAMSDTADETSDGTRPPRAFRRLKPVYPAAAAHAEVEAVVDVLVDVDEKGEVSRAEIARWAGYGLDESVMDTVKQLHFFPAMRDRHAIPMRVLLRYNFRKPTESPAQ